MSKIDHLARAFADHVAIAWPASSSGAQRVVMVVYDPSDERALRRKLDLFAQGATDAGNTWVSLDLTPLIAEWLAAHRYRETYFQEPEELFESGEDRISRAISDAVKAPLCTEEHDEHAVLAIYGVAAVFGFTNLSSVIARVEHAIRGRLVVFFPGRVHEGRYRLLDARESWDYHAVPITVDNSGVM